MNLDRKEWVLIQRYITGNAEPNERRRINEWMDQDPENRRLVRELKEIWNLTPEENFNVDIQQAWEKFRDKNRMNISENRNPIGYKSREVSRKPLYILRVAAVILVAFLTGIFVQNHLSTLDQVSSEQANAFNVLQKLETERGEKARVTFSDGSSVTLNSASFIRFPEKFHGSTREVYLEGEAYFQIAHNPDNPFIVHSQGAEIEVLGTEFNVRGWNEDSAVEVIVRGGKVSVKSTSELNSDQSEVILTQGYKTLVERGQSPAAARQVDVTRHLLWTSGGMHFEDEPFIQVIKDLERRFNIQITVEDEMLLNVPYTGTFQYAELNEVLSVIAASMEVGYSRVGNEIEFHN